jgi:hypothetical protein
MKKTFFYSLLVLLCFSFFSGQSNYINFSTSENNSESKLTGGWVLKISSDTAQFINVFFKTENLGCIYTGYHPVRRTTDGGNTWGYGTVPSLLTEVNGGIYSNGSDIFMTANQNISPLHYVGYLFRSSDMGLNWTIAHSTPFNPYVPRYHVTVLFKNIGYLFIENYYLPFWRKTNDGGNSWLLHANVDPPAGTFAIASSVGYKDTNIIYGTYGGNIGKCVSGVTGGLFYVIKYGSFTKIFVVDSSNILALSGIKLFRSVNAGVSWDSTNFPVQLYSINFPDQNTGYMTGGGGKIYKTINKGANWYSQVTPITDNLVDCCFLNSMTGYVIGSSGTLLKTNDGGVNTVFSVSGQVRYSDNNQPATGGYVKAIKFDKPTGNIITYDSVQIQANGNYVLTNVPQDSVDIGVYPNSTTQNDWVMTYYPSTIYWQNAATIYPTGNLTNINIGAIRLTSSTNNNSVNGKVMRLNDNPSLAHLKDAVLYAKSGNTFVRCGVSDANGVYHLPYLPAGSLKIIVNRLGFTGDSTNVTVTSTSNLDSVNFYLYQLPVGIKQIGNVVPSEYKLYQNYPNPFNPATIIKFQIKDSKFVTLKIYDILGREVITLVNEKLRAGIYEIPFSINSITNNQIPSGVYFYKLLSEDFTEVKKMLLIK